MLSMVALEGCNLAHLMMNTVGFVMISNIFATQGEFFIETALFDGV